MQLVEQGILTLDEPINKYIPEMDKCLLVEQTQGTSEDDNKNDDKEGKKVTLRRPSKEITLRHLIMNTSGMGTCDTYETLFGNDETVPRPDFSDDAHPLMKDRSTHLFFEPGEGFDYGWSIYSVQLLVERLGDKDRYVQYMDEHVFKVLGMTSSTYLPATTPAVWDKRLQMVQRVEGNMQLKAQDEHT